MKAEGRQRVSEPLVIDTKMHGRDRITGAFLVIGRSAALVETGPKSSVRHVIAALDAAGIDSLAWIVVTHIHLDHAGGAGSLAARYPEAKVAVHPAGAPHLSDPTKLWSSAARIYGDDMERLWGGIDPVASERVHVLHDGDEVDLGGRALRAVETLGHAGHHHSFVDSDTGAVFVGDALGVRLPSSGVVRPATPPPEFDLDLARASIARIRGLGAGSLWLTHFGPQDAGTEPLAVEEACDRACEALERWGEWVRAARAIAPDLDTAYPLVEARARADLEGTLDPEAVALLEQTTSYRMNVWGFMRYFDRVSDPRNEHLRPNTGGRLH